MEGSESSPKLPSIGRATAPQQSWDERAVESTPAEEDTITPAGLRRPPPPAAYEAAHEAAKPVPAKPLREPAGASGGDADGAGEPVPPAVATRMAIIEQCRLKVAFTPPELRRKATLHQTPLDMSRWQSSSRHAAGRRAARRAVEQFVPPPRSRSLF